MDFTDFVYHHATSLIPNMESSYQKGLISPLSLVLGVLNEKKTTYGKS